MPHWVPYSLGAPFPIGYSIPVEYFTPHWMLYSPLVVPFPLEFSTLCWVFHIPLGALFPIGFSISPWVLHAFPVGGEAMQAPFTRPHWKKQNPSTPSPYAGYPGGVGRDAGEDGGLVARVAAQAGDEAGNAVHLVHPINFTVQGASRVALWRDTHQSGAVTGLGVEAVM